MYFFSFTPQPSPIEDGFWWVFVLRQDPFLSVILFCVISSYHNTTTSNITSLMWISIYKCGPCNSHSTSERELKQHKLNIHESYIKVMINLKDLCHVYNLMTFKANILC